MPNRLHHRRVPQPPPLCALDQLTTDQPTITDQPTTTDQPIMDQPIIERPLLMACLPLMDHLMPALTIRPLLHRLHPRRALSLLSQPVPHLSQPALPM